MESPQEFGIFDRGSSTAPPLTESLRRSTRAVVIAQAASQLVTLASMAVLLRLLGLEPYGLMFFVLAVLNLVRIFVISGLDLATIQQQEELSEEQVSALFWINQALGLAMTVLVAAGAPVLVWFYGRPIGWLTVAMAGTSWASALGLQHMALLQRRLRLGAVAYVRLASLTLGSISGILGALAGWGVWALVLQQYVELIALAAIAWMIEPWRPQFTLQGAGVGSLVRFGGHCTLSNLMLGVINNFDKILIGRVLGEDLLALYNQAFNLVQKPITALLTPLTGIMMPGLCRAMDDHDQYRRLLLVFFRVLGLVMLPIGIGLAVVAPETMRVLGGAKWSAAGPILVVLALSILVQGSFIALGSVLASAGRADRLARCSVVNALVMCSSYFVGLYVGQWLGDPVIGVAWAYTLTLLVVVFPVYLGVTLRTVRVGYVDWLAQLKVSLPATVGMGVAVFGCRWLLTTYLAWPDLPRLAVEVSLGVMVYVLLAWSDIRWFLRQGLRVRPESPAYPSVRPSGAVAGLPTEPPGATEGLPITPNFPNPEP